MKKTICVIPAAGKGTRLQPLTATRPKAMLEVVGKPILYHIFDSVIEAGIREFVVIIGYLKEEIEQSIIADYPNVTVHFIEQEKQQGLGHAVLLAKKYIPQNTSILLIYGDTLFQTNIEKLILSSVATIGTYQVDAPQQFGVIELDDNQEYISNLVEKPEHPVSNFIIAGVNFFPDVQVLFESIEYIISNNIKTKNEYNITHAFLYMLQQGIRMKSLLLEGWNDCGTFQALLDTNQTILSNKRPPNIVGNNVILEDTELGPYVSISPNCRITNTILNNCIIHSGTTIENSHLQNSIVGTNSHISRMNGSLQIGSNSIIRGK